MKTIYSLSVLPVVSEAFLFRLSATNRAGNSLTETPHFPALKALFQKWRSHITDWNRKSLNGAYNALSNTINKQLCTGISAATASRGDGISLHIETLTP
jgi:hypothetical protein